VLKEEGYRVMAKTTGSRPVILFPDGREEEIKRRGLPSILEQKRILNLGRNINIDALVLEMMSIRPETAYVESVQILKPQILVVTNVRLDHLAEMGTTKDRIARGFACGIARGGTVFVPQDEFVPVYRQAAARMKAKVIQVSEDSFEHPSLLDQKIPDFEWEENARLALAVADFLKLDRTDAFRGMMKTQPDFGSLKMWRVESGSPPRQLECISCFAANDPESTRLALSKLQKMIGIEGKKWVGLLNLRNDRGDRTLQWLTALKQRTFPEFGRIYLVGFHARAFKRKFGNSNGVSIDILKKMKPDKLVSQILKQEEGPCVLVGIGNIGGAGRDLVDFWEKEGEPHDL